MKEIWKDIKGFEGLYKISNLGNIKSLKTNKNLYYSKSSKSKKYLRVSLYKNGIRKGRSIHRLVAETFIPNPENKPCINHKDCNPANNKVENLEWCTYKENNSHKNHGLRRNISSAIYFLKRDYPNEINLINDLENIKKKIDIL